MSGLFGTTNRLPKDSLIYEALGTLDELNSFLGVCRAREVRKKNPINISQEIGHVQEQLFIIQAELAGAEKSILQTHIDALEDTIHQIENRIINPGAFVIPGSTESSAFFDFARAIARRTERAVIRASEIRDVSPESRAYMNRLSSLLYALARYTALRKGAKEPSPSY